MAAIFGEQPKEHPSVGRIRARAIAGLKQWASDLAFLEENEENVASAKRHMNVLNNKR